MNPEKIVELINKAKALMNEPAITLEQYQASLESDKANPETVEAQRHKMAADGGKIYRARIALLDKYSGVHKDNPFTRCYRHLLKEEKTEKDAAYNREIMKKLGTAEGVAELLENSFRELSRLPASVYFPGNDAEICSNYEKYGGLMEIAFNMSFIRGKMEDMGITVEPEVEKFLDTHRNMFDLLGKQTGLIHMWSSPFYTAFGDTEKFSQIVIAAGSNSEDPSPEQKEFNYYAQNAITPLQYALEEDVIRGGRLLRNSGTAENHRYVTGNLRDIAKSADEGTVLPLMNEEEQQALDAAFAGHFCKTREQRAVISAQPVIRTGVMKGSRERNPETSGEKMLRLFGPTFKFDEGALDSRVYTEDVFKMNNYTLPEDCPFSEEEAAVIGLASMSQNGIGDLSRRNLSEDIRVSGNFAFCTENMISGSYREGVGNLLRESVFAARNNVRPLIEQYMNGNKRPLAKALSDSIKLAAATFNEASHYGTNSAFNGRFMNKAVNIIMADPEMMNIVREEGLISEHDLKLADLGRQMAKYFDERAAILDKFCEEIDAGRNPSPELKKAVVEKTLVLDFLSRQKVLDSNEYQKTPEFAAEERKINLWVRRHLGEPDTGDIMTARFSELNQKAPVSAFSEQLLQPYALEHIEKMVGDSEYAKSLAGKQCDEIVNALIFEKSNGSMDGTISEQVRNELTANGSIDRFMNTIVMDKISDHGPATRKNLGDDAATLSRLTSGMHEAQQDVHLGSEAFNDVENDLKLIERANRRILEDSSLLTEENAETVRKAYDKLTADCNRYLQRKERQGKLDVDPGSKTGKRIKMVREALKFSERGSAKFAITGKFIQHSKEETDLHAQAEKLLYDSLTAETAGPLMKNLNNLAAENSDPERGRKIVSQLNIVARFINDRGLSPQDCGLEVMDFQKSMDTMKAGGVGKKAADRKTGIKKEGKALS